MSAALAPDTILRELSNLWVSLGKQSNEETGAGVLRACTMTLVVLAEMSEDAAGLGETVAALMPEHPARAIMVRLEGAGEPSLAARVYSQCWMPFHERRQICCEQIEITATDASLADLPPVILPLAAPDLPVIVWCRSARLARMPEFWNIARMANKVVVDGGALGSPAEALARLRETVRSGMVVGDLAWTRLTRWRETLAQVFENRSYLELLPRISQVRISYANGQDTSALYMGTWVANGVRAAGGHVKVELARSDAFGVSLAGENLRVEESWRGGRLTVSVDGLSQCANLPEATDYAMMREELGILRHDRVFESTLASAAPE